MIVDRLHDVNGNNREEVAFGESFIDHQQRKKSKSQKLFWMTIHYSTVRFKLHATARPLFSAFRGPPEARCQYFRKTRPDPISPYEPWPRLLPLPWRFFTSSTSLQTPFESSPSPHSQASGVDCAMQSRWGGSRQIAQCKGLAATTQCATQVCPLTLHGFLGE